MADYSRIDAGLFTALKAWEMSGADTDDRITVTLKFEGAIQPLLDAGFDAQDVRDGEAFGAVRFRDIDALTLVPGVVWISVGEKRQKLLDTAVEDIKARASSAGNASASGDGLWHVTPDGASLTGLANATGEGVIIAIIDTGIDYTHPMFNRASGPPPASRILRIWDQGLRPANAGEAPSASLLRSSVSYGLEIRNDLPTNHQINDALAAGTNLRHRDCDGHGTHVAGIAAGGRRFWPGGNTAIMGVAPEADIIAVKMLDTPDEIRDLNNNIVSSQAQFRDAVLYCLRLARQFTKPIVINMSFGNSTEAGDGLDEDAQFLEGLLDPAAPAGPDHFPSGAILVKAAGNDGDPARRLCAKITVGSSGMVTVPLMLDDHRAGAQNRFDNCQNQLFAPAMRATFWYKRANPFESVSFALRYPDLPSFSGEMPVGGNLFQGYVHRVGPPPRTAFTTPADNVFQALVLHGGEPSVPHPDGGTVRRHSVRLTLFPRIRAGTATYYTGIYEMRIRAPENTELFVMGTRAGWAPGQFVTLKVHDRLIDPLIAIDPNEIAVGPSFAATDTGGRSVITVAAYDDHDGGAKRTAHRIAAFSSWGPLRDYSEPPRGPLAVKPDVAAPGVKINSALSRDTQLAFLHVLDADWGRGRRFKELQGTSMAAPAVSGLIALLLNKDSNLTPAAAIAALSATARAGGNPTTIPEKERAFGTGMVDALEAHKAV